MHDPHPPLPRPDLSGWLTAAAIFWFEAPGIMGVALLGILPYVGFMHGTVPPDMWTDSGVLRLATALAVVAGYGAVVWMIGRRYLRGRAVAFLGLGVAGFVAIAASVPDNSLPMALLWIGWPSLTLVKVWSKPLRRTLGRPSSMDRAI